MSILKFSKIHEFKKIKRFIKSELSIYVSDTTNLYDGCIKYFHHKLER